MVRAQLEESYGESTHRRAQAPRIVRRQIVAPHARGQRAHAHHRHPRASVLPRSQKRSHSGLALQLVPAAALFLTLVFQLWIRVAILESGYILESRRQEAVNNDATVRRLRSQLATLNTPRNLVQRAKKELNMGLPTTASIRKIEVR